MRVLFGKMEICRRNTVAFRLYRHEACGNANEARGQGLFLVLFIFMLAWMWGFRPSEINQTGVAKLVKQIAGVTYFVDASNIYQIFFSIN